MSIRKKGIVSLLVSISLMTMVPIGANATTTTGWQGSDLQGWWYVDNTGNYVTGWKEINGNWYYFDSLGWMESNVTIDGYKLGADGSWVQQPKSQSSDNESAIRARHKEVSSSSGDAEFQRHLQQNSK